MRSNGFSFRLKHGIGCRCALPRAALWGRVEPTSRRVWGVIWGDLRGPRVKIADTPV